MNLSRISSLSSTVSYEEYMYSIQACDRCNVRKLKCDRRLPNCQRCSKRNEECTYNRKLKKIAQPSKKKTIEIIKPTNVTAKNSYQTSFRVFQPNKDKINRSITIKVQHCVVLGTSWENYFLFLIGQPKLYLNLIKSENMRKAMTNLRQKVSNSESIIKDKFIMDKIYQQAIDMYFSNVNQFYMLFIKDYFFIKKRSKLMMNLILFSGLRFLPATKEVIHLMKLHEQYIADHILPFNHKMNLDYLQCVLIFYMGLRGMGISERHNWLCNSLVITLANMVGLHHNYKQFNKIEIIERKLAYTIMIKNDAVKGIVLNVPNMLTSHHLNNIKLNKLDNDFNIKHQFTLDQIDCLQQLKWIKHRIHNKLIDEKRLVSNFNKILNKFKMSYEIKMNSTKYLSTVTFFHYEYMQTITHMAMVLISFKFPNHIDHWNDNSIYHYAVKSFLKYVVQLIHTLFQIEKQTHNIMEYADRVSVLSLSIIFLIRYSKLLDNSIPNLVQHGIDLLQRFLNYEFSKSRANYYLGIIHQLVVIEKFEM